VFVFVFGQDESVYIRARESVSGSDGTTNPSGYIGTSRGVLRNHPRAHLSTGTGTPEGDDLMVRAVASYFTVRLI
jgi:hypothetical protein